jgi:transposase
VAGEAGGGRDRGDDGLALGRARAAGARLRGALGRSGRASALRGRRRRPKTDRLDARWLALLLARELLSECEAWLPPAEIQRLRDRTRLRKALAGERTGWAQRLHALLAHEGWPCSRGRLLTREGSRWVAALELDAHVRAQVDVIVAVMAALEEQLELVESELRRFARADRRCEALQTIFGVVRGFLCI